MRASVVERAVLGLASPLGFLHALILPAIWLVF